MTELEIQSKFVEMVEDFCPDVLFCATVGGARMSIREARKIKMSGYRKGIPDVIFYEPRNGYHGLAIEIKRKGGRVSPHQKKWVLDLQRRGFYAEVCIGLDACLKCFDSYFGSKLTHTL